MRNCCKVTDVLKEAARYRSDDLPMILRLPVIYISMHPHLTHLWQVMLECNMALKGRSKSRGSSSSISLHSYSMRLMLFCSKKWYATSMRSSACSRKQQA